ncbi:hypothetical protein COV18_07415 [Candidatus Woesearchaeota archaeon CG10_big_fil_rev_8_21_14_0_10_37_12]|nr:MAG: hypothetical protein COV18_07415 [Candidatus Woesearchaeota archaeon CG10_big_fil_rev_8_21_14_0_10_37_12]
MTLREPESMEECVYFTNRAIDNGHAKAWVFREKCPKCKKGMMSKPFDEKAGKFKTRATEYVCPECKHSVEKEEYEGTLTANIAYTCPHCKHKGETQIPYKRKTFKGVPSLIFECSSCKEKVGVTKKMKEAKGKKSKAPIDLDDE